MALAAASFTACAIDVRGYGGSDKPHAVEAYAMKEIAADVAGVIEALSPGKPRCSSARLGAPIVWHTAVLHPKQSARCCGPERAVVRSAADVARCADQGDVRRSQENSSIKPTSKMRASLKQRSNGRARWIAQTLLCRQRRLSGLWGGADKSMATICSMAWKIRTRFRGG